MNDSNLKNLWWTLILVMVVGLVAAGAFGLRKHGSAADETPAAAAASTGRVAFRMEQQWLIKLKLAKAEEAEMAPQIRSTGRVVPVPTKHAVVAPPVGGIIQAGTIPRVGHQVRQGGRLATLLPTTH